MNTPRTRRDLLIRTSGLALTAAAGVMGVTGPSIAVGDDGAPHLRFAVSAICAASALRKIGRRESASTWMGPQAYRTGRSPDGALAITAGDLTGAMYAALDVAEATTFRLSRTQSSLSGKQARSMPIADYPRNTRLASGKVPCLVPHDSKIRLDDGFNRDN